MTHKQCSETVAFNLNLIGKNYKNEKIAALVIIDASLANREAQIKYVLDFPESPAALTLGDSYEVFVVFNKATFTPEGKISYLPLEEILSTIELVD